MAILGFPSTSIIDSTSAGRALLTAANAAAQRTLLGLGTGDTPTFTALVLAGQSLTGSSSTSVFDASTTWDTSGTPTAWKLNVTDTNSNPASLLFDLQIGAISKFKVVKSGVITLNNITTFTANSADELIISSTSGYQRVKAYSLWHQNMAAGIGDSGQAGGPHVHLSSAGMLGWTSGANINLATYDLFLVRDASGTLAQRNGVNSQTFRLYNTFTNSTNYERGKLAWELDSGSPIFRIGTEAAGTGTARDLQLQTNATTRLTILGTGNVGVGTTAPSYKFSVAGDIYASNYVYGAVAFIGRLLLNANPNDLVVENSAAYSILFRTNGLERVRINSSGNVGIGTSSPSYRLQINGGSMYLDHSYAFYVQDIRGVSGLYLNQGTAANVLLATGGGNVGVGTASPTQKLHVDGSVRVTGAYYDSTNSAGTSGQVLKSTATGTDWVDPYDLVGVNADFVKTIPGNRFVENLQTGVLYGGVITVNALDNTKVDISAGAGIIVSMGASTTAMPVPTVTTVTWTAKTAVTLTYLATHEVTWLSINSSGNVVQSTSEWSESGYQTELPLGVAIHPNNTSVSFTKQATHLSYGQATLVDPFVRAFGPLKLSGNTISAYSTNLQISRSSGTSYSLGANYAIDPNNPNIVTDTNANPVTSVHYYYNNGSGGFNVQVGSLVDPTKYDNGSGTLQTVSGGKYTIQRIFSCPTQPTLIGIYYGTQEYNSIEEAEANIPYEIFSESDLTSNQGVFCGYLIVKGNTTNLSVAADAKFVQAGLFRSISAVTAGGQAITALDDLTDVVITSPVQGNFLRYNAATSSWVNGTGVDGTGTTNYVPKWSDSDTLANSLIFDNGTNVGIGTASPSEKFQIVNGNILLSATYGIRCPDNFRLYDTTNSIDRFLFSSNNSYNTRSGGEHRFQINGSQVVVITSDGKVGIGSNSPNAQLQFSATVANRKITLYEVNNNDHEFYGLGINAGILRYQVSATSNSHVFYAGASSSSSNELMRITGTGNVGIGTNNPSAPLDIVKDGGASTVTLLELNNSNAIYQQNVSLSMNTSKDILWDQGSASGGTFWNAGTRGYGWSINGSRIVTFDLLGNVGIGTSSPAALLHVSTAASETDFVRLSAAGQNLNLKYMATPNSFVFTSTSGRNINFYNDGNVGIGFDTAPSQKLHVTGNIRVTGAYYDSSNTAGSSGNVLTSTGTGTAWSSLASAGIVGGSGTANYVTKWNSANTIANSSIYDDGANVGIGTTSPNQKLTIDGNINFVGTGNYITWRNGDVRLSRLTGAGNGYEFAISTYDGVALAERVRVDKDGNFGILSSRKFGSGNGYVGDTASASSATLELYNAATGKTTLNNQTYTIGLQTAGVDRITILNNGNVGIGTTAPSYRLHVVGGSMFLDGGNNDTRYYVFSSATSSSWVGYELRSSNVNSFAGGIFRSNADNNRVSIFSKNSECISIVDSTGNVGINILTPESTLHVNGDLTIADKIAHAGDNNTAIRFPSNDTISFETSGAESFRVTSLGRIGVGTTSPTYNLDVAGSIGAVNAYANYYNQLRSGEPRSNLGNPTVTEIAAFQEQFDNKLAFYPPSNITYETFDGTTWTEVILTDSVKKNLVGGDTGTAINIPYGTQKFRFNIRNKNSYVNVNTLYLYFSGQGHTTQVHIWSKHDSGSWVQNTSSTTAVGGWPAHVYLPFSGLWWLIGGTLGSHVNDIRIEFTPSWNGTYPSNGIQIYRMQLWGGYPAAKRTIYSVDADQNVYFPAQIAVGNNPSKAIITYTTNAQRTLTIPPVSGDRTFAFIDDAQTFSSNQTFSGSITNTGSGTTFKNRIGIGDGNGTPYTNTGTPGVWLSYNGGTNAFMGMFSSTVWGTYLGDWRMVVNNSGNVGIATTSPSEKLHVVGNGYFVGYIGVNQTPSSFYDIYTSGPIRSNTAYIAASNTGYYSIGTSSDVILTRDAANTLAQRNGVNAQTFNIYNTYTDTSNYERAKIAWQSNVLIFGTEKSGTGSARAMQFVTDGTVRITIGSTGLIQTANSVLINSSSILGWVNRSYIASPSDGVLKLNNNGGSDFNRLQFGGETASFPAFKRNGTSIEVRLADDSAQTSLFAGSIGIATTSPSEALHVVGNIRVTGAYYDSANSAGSSGQVLASTGTGTDWVTLSEITGVDGSGTLNYITKWTPDGNTIGNSQIFDNGTSVGIGTASPTAALQLQKPNGTVTVLQIDGDGATPNALISSVKFRRFNYDSTGTGAEINVYRGNSGAEASIAFCTNPGSSSGQAATERMRITDTGNVGIGTTTPASKISLQTNATGTYAGNHTNAGDYGLDVYNSQTTSNGSYASLTFRVGSPNSNLGTGSVNLVNTGDGNGDLTFITRSSSVSSEKVRITHGGNVGIGNTAPTAKLDISDTSLAGSGSLAGSILNLAQTWNTTGAPTAIKLNVTDTASNSASLLMDLQVGGSTMFRVTKAGAVYAQVQIDSASSFRAVNNNGFFSIGGTPDTYWFRDAAGIFAQRNGVNAQTLRVYNTYTDASNYERGKFAWSSNVLQIGTEKLGTGVARALEIQTDGTTRITVAATGAVTFAGAVNISSSTQMTYDGSSLSTTTATSITTFAAATYGSAEYLVQVRDTVTGQRQISKILIVHDGTTAYSTEYGVVFTGTAALATFTVDISAGNVRLLAAGATANSTEYKILKTTITV